MEKQIKDPMDDYTLAPAELIALMFDRTDEDGILYIPEFCYGTGFEDPESYRCHVDWNLAKRDKLIADYEKHYAALEKIAGCLDALDDTLETAREVLKDPELINTWNTYIRPFDIGDMDHERVADIADRIEMIESVKDAAATLANGETLSEYDKQLLTEYVNISVSGEEEEYYHMYFRTLRREAEKRIGNNIFAYEVFFYSRRLCKLINVKAPGIIVINEAHCLARAMMLHNYGVSAECVSDNVRLHIARLEQMSDLMSDEELDKLYRPKNTNSLKSMAPLFVYSILKAKSDTKTHLRQQDILKELAKYPYEIKMERKALSRIIHNLVDLPQYAVFSDKSGVWVDQERTLIEE